jgi:hypothetical protein
MIGEGERPHLQLLRPVDELMKLRGAVEETKLRMTM